MYDLWSFVQQTAAGTLTALLLLLLQRVFRDKLSPRWQYGIWGVLLLRLLVPAGLLGRSTVLDGTFWLELLRTRVELGLASAYSSPWAVSLPSGPLPLPPGGGPASVTDWLFLLYWAGVFCSALWFLFAAARLALRVGRGVPVEGARLAGIERTAEKYGLPRPRRVVECRWKHGPFLMGVFRPALVLPMGWEPEEKVILHELLHLKHRDVAAGWVTTLFRCVHWCNPVLWLVFDKIGNDREALCDQRVLERLEGEDRRDYGRVLLSMAEDRGVRTPGATTMANGGRAVKARIQAIARFKRYPQGMGLVSGCIALALILSLVVGTPSTAGQEASLEVPDRRDGAGILTLAAMNRPTTVIGALDCYGKALYYREKQDPGAALLCAALAAPRSELPQLYAHRDEHSSGTWTTGPILRGLISDGGAGYLCQVFWFRDGPEPETPPEDREDWPIQYLCHTVRVLPDGPHWTVERLAETTGALDGFLESDSLYAALYGPVTWSGTADGVTVQLSPAHTAWTGSGMLGEENLTALDDPDSFVDPFSLLSRQQDTPSQDGPLPQQELFSTVWSGLFGILTNTGDHPVQFALQVTPLWNDPGVQTEDTITPTQISSGTAENQAAFRLTTSLYPLEPGEAIQDNWVGGGGGYIPLTDAIGPDGYSAALVRADGTQVPVALTPRYTTPDGGSYSLEPAGAGRQTDTGKEGL